MKTKKPNEGVVFFLEEGSAEMVLSFRSLNSSSLCLLDICSTGVVRRWDYIGEEHSHGFKLESLSNQKIVVKYEPLPEEME